MPAFNPGTSFSLTSRFSSARSLMGVTRPHKGVDFRAISGTAIPAAGNGKVVLKKFNRGGYGHYVILEHRNKDGEFIHTLYAHMKESSRLNVGDRIAKGSTIGFVGSTGRSTGPHLHFEVHRHRKSGQPLANPREEVDPLEFDVSGLQYPDEVHSDTASNIVKNEITGASCLPITQSDGREFKDAKDLAALLGDEANYLLGLNTWHGGIHISDEKAPWVKDIHPVRCMADGEVVAFRMMPDYLVSNFKGREYRYSNSFCLVRHYFKQPKSAEENKGSTQKENSSEKGRGAEDNGFTYYTLYMHLCPWDTWPKNSRYRLKKGWRVRHSVPNHDYQPPALTLKAGEEFELVEGVTAQRGYVTGQGEFEFARIKILSNGASSKEVLATKGMDGLWMAQDPSAIEKVGNIVRPMWVYDKIEARVKEDMVGRADPKAQKGKTGHYVAGDSVFSVPAGSLISFDAHRCEWQEVRGRARRMARCVVQPLGRPVWLCVEEENIEIKRQEPTHLGKLYELPTPVPIRAGETIGYLGMYEAPTSTEGGMSSKHMVHIELFSDDPRAEAVVSSKEWKDQGFTLIDGSDSDGALDPAKIPPFFLNLYRHASDDKELKDDELTVKKLENAVDSIENYDRVKGMVVKHSSEWWVPASKIMMEQFKIIFCKVTDLPPLIEHEVKRVEALGWMDKLSHVHIAGPKVLHFYPFSISCENVVKRELIWMKRVFELYGIQIGEAFRNKVIKVGGELGIDPNYIMACIALETGTRFDPSIKNPYSSATGLIQLMRASAKEIGTTVEALAKMNHVEQMDYVKMYFVSRAEMFGVPTNRWSLEDVYLSIFAPSAIAIDGNAPVYSSPSENYNRNKFHDLNGDGKIMKSEIANNIRVFYDKGFSYEG
ncbi:peptidoglycan DD-metalloendopeptidase family protein [Aeromonas veronii]|uniref:peptidoglycan DD-metalloendopeptidase family protein n=1 Tax=Aeromonas veronii TaxID=654 RepID=UPI001F301BAE|nr:M23 family metallopeptidase [Aeromonas veronii]MCF5915227.1 peptidoglycan DD-metalloendopeptidase family protein [Aeromonas veronii]HDO1325517.1 M23 family metallopeptidase [Aeromonas veronii]